MIIKTSYVKWTNSNPQVHVLKNQDQKIFFVKCLLNLPLLSAILYSELILIVNKFLYA